MSHSLAISWRHVVFPLVVCLLGGGLALAFSADAPPSPPAPVPLGWVDYVSALRNPADVRGKPGAVKRLLKKVVGLDDSDSGMVQPHGVTVDAQGRVLVADTRARLVHIFDAVRHKYSTLRAPASNPFVSPIAIATGGDLIYVSDSGRARIFVFRSDGKFLRTLGALGKNESIFKRCTGLALDTRAGRLYVVDTIAMQMVVMSLEGKVLARWGHAGDGPAEFNYPTHIAVADDGTLWVVDSLNFRVQHLDQGGNFLSAFGRPGDGVDEFDKPKGISVDRAGRIYVVEGRSDRVQVYDREGRLLSYFGHSGSGPGEFFLPAGIALDLQDRIYVADGYNGRVEIFQPHSAAAAGGQ